jgi:hypothetical protein
MSSQPPKKPRVQHPLRQASFPAEPDSDPRVYSGSIGGRTDYDARSGVGSFTGSLAGSFAESADGRTSVSGSMARGRGGGRKRGRRDRDGAMSVRAGAGGSAAGSVGEGTAAAEDEEEEDDYLGDAGLLGEDQGASDAVAEKENLAYVTFFFLCSQPDSRPLANSWAGSFLMLLIPTSLSATTCSRERSSTNPPYAKLSTKPSRSPSRRR